MTIFVPTRSGMLNIIDFAGLQDDTVTERVTRVMQFWLCLMFSHELYKINIVDVTGSLIPHKISVLSLHSEAHASPYLKRQISAVPSI